MPRFSATSATGSGRNSTDGSDPKRIVWALRNNLTRRHFRCCTFPRKRQVLNCALASGSDRGGLVSTNGSDRVRREVALHTYSIVGECTGHTGRRMSEVRQYVTCRRRKVKYLVYLAEMIVAFACEEARTRIRASPASDHPDPAISQ
jgi:hypothetical protein